MTERWRKLLWNIPFNGLSIAGAGATVADVLNDEGLRTLSRELMSEVLDAARAPWDMRSRMNSLTFRSSEAGAWVAIVLPA